MEHRLRPSKHTIVCAVMFFIGIECTAARQGPEIYQVHYSYYEYCDKPSPFLLSCICLLLARDTEKLFFISPLSASSF